MQKIYHQYKNTHCTQLSTKNKTMVYIDESGRALECRISKEKDVNTTNALYVRYVNKRKYKFTDLRKII